jgi:hypothetical protein
MLPLNFPSYYEKTYQTNITIMLDASQNMLQPFFRWNIFFLISLILLMFASCCLYITINSVYSSVNATFILIFVFIYTTCFDHIGSSSGVLTLVLKMHYKTLTPSLLVSTCYSTSIPFLRTVFLVLICFLCLLILHIREEHSTVFPPLSIQGLVDGPLWDQKSCR